MFDDIMTRLRAVLDVLPISTDSLKDFAISSDDLSAYGEAAWQTVLYFYQPKLAVLYAAVGFLFLLARIFLKGVVGWLARSAALGGIAAGLAGSAAFGELYPEPLQAALVASIITLGLWLPVGIAGFLLVRLTRPKAALLPAASGRASAGEAFDVQRQGKEHRQVVVIMMTDIVGYSARMEKNEAATYALLKEHNVIMRRAITTHRGREIKTIGDAFMVVFQAPLDALRCAIAMQKGLHAFNKPRAVNDHLKVRIGLFQGEATVTEKDVFGEAVNIAARMESITDPGGISCSADIYQAVKGKVDVGFQSVGIPKMKNIAKPPEVFRVHVDHQ